MVLEIEKEKNMSKCILAAMNDGSGKSTSVNSFDNFMVFEGNMIAYNAAKSIAYGSVNTYNPLFIYGDMGTGKTHLLKAIEDVALLDGEDKGILYVTAEEFKNDVLTGGSDNYGMAMVREIYRHADVLLVDDIQCLLGDDAALKEFLYTIDSLIRNGSKIVISANVPPKKLNVDEDLQYKLGKGLVIEVKAPDTSKKKDLIRVKAGEYGILLQDEVIDYIATNTGANVGEIESAIISIHAYSELSKPAINLGTAQKVLKDIIDVK